MSESFADCQDFIQLQEQEFFRLKLQHALDLKVELIAYKESVCKMYVCILQHAQFGEAGRSITFF